MLDHSLLKRLKSSKCLCGEIQLKEDNDKKDNNDIEKNNNMMFCIHRHNHQYSYQY